MTSTAIPPTLNAELRAILRKRAGEWLARSYRHDLLVARTVRGMQVEAQQEFDRMVVNPLLKAIGGTLATFAPRGSDVIPEAFPQIAALQREIAQVIDRGAESVHRLTQRRMAEVVQVEAAWTRGTATALGGGIAPPAVNVASAERQAIDRPFLGDKTERWFEKMLSGPTKDNVRAWVNAGIQQGLTTDEVVRGLRGTKEQAGILADKPRHAVAALVRTAATHASQVGREAGFKAIGVTHYRFVATLDTLTSVQCAANDGKVFELGKGPVPPLHPNCRSATVPVWDPKEKPDGDRASIDGPVPADQSFEDWLGQQSKKDQDEALGKTKAEAWRSGKLPLAKMLGADLQPLTLAELRAMDRI